MSERTDAAQSMIDHPDAGVSARIDALDWAAIAAELDDVGAAPMGAVLDPDGCAALVAAYDDDGRFRSTVDMERFRFGAGQYRYFDAPLPALVDTMRQALWPHLLTVARRWAQRSGQSAPWPDTLDQWLAVCHAGGQDRPTPLLLRYGPGDWNALHRDLYGEHVFPLQVVIGLDRPEVDYDGGELVVVEQRPRAQSRATTLRLAQGHAVVFTTRDRPVASPRGWTTTAMRHGVSTVRRGRRHTLGLLFHDAS